MLRITGSILIFILLIGCNNHLFAQNDTIILFDTVYLPADTIKNIDTIFIYEETDPITNTTIQKKRKKKNSSEYSIGPFLGINPSLDYYITGGLDLIFEYNHIFTEISFKYNSVLTNQISYIKQYSVAENYVEVVKTKVEEFIQIVGEDTTVITIYQYDYVNKTKTSYKDSTYKHTNAYRSLSIPVIIGICKKNKKYMFGIAGGIQCRLIFPEKANKVIEDSLFVPEDKYLKTFKIDAMIQAIAKQKITKKTCITESLGVSIPLSSDFESKNMKIFKNQIYANIGLQYFFTR